MHVTVCQTRARASRNFGISAKASHVSERKRTTIKLIGMAMVVSIEAQGTGVHLIMSAKTLYFRVGSLNYL